MSARTELSEQRLGKEARKLHRAAEKWRQRRDDADEEMRAALDALTALWRKTCERFGREVPLDALLLDVLDAIDVEEGPDPAWRWRGTWNNNGLATVRLSTKGEESEQSVVRFLAIALGVIDADEHGLLYPANGDKADVNPWHRHLRRMDRPNGYAGRFGFTPEVES